MPRGGKRYQKYFTDEERIAAQKRQAHESYLRCKVGMPRRQYPSRRSVPLPVAKSVRGCPYLCRCERCRGAASMEMR